MTSKELLYNYTDDKTHQELSNYLKNVHLSLRKTASKLGAEKAWQQHCQDKEILNKYAKFMEKLATEHWIDNESQCRISWGANFLKNYFIDKYYLTYNRKDRDIASKIDVIIDCEEHTFSGKIKLLDVGSCYNPFKRYGTFLDITAIDLCPATDSVLQCDFLYVPVGSQTIVEGKEVKQLCEESFNAVVFSFLLEYIPTSDLRISACNRAYLLLKPGGLLIICTPDSKHVGANAKQMKCWRYTLAQLGFSRIHYNKYKFIHCMAFRKTLHKLIAVRWAQLYKEPYMEYAINIPQDFNMSSDDKVQPHKLLSILIDFAEMPFCNSEIL